MCARLSSSAAIFTYHALELLLLQSMYIVSGASDPTDSALTQLYDLVSWSSITDASRVRLHSSKSMGWINMIYGRPGMIEMWRGELVDFFLSQRTFRIIEPE